MNDNISFIQPKDAWDALSIPGKAEMMRVAVSHGIYNLKDIRQKYNEFAMGGDTEESIAPYEQRTEVVITPDSEYNQYLNTLPDNQRFTPNDKYDSYLYWKLHGKPKNFNEAIRKGMFTYDHSDNAYHSNSVAWGDDGVGYFMKPKSHNTVGYELDWFNKGLVTEEGGWQRPETFTEWKESRPFRSAYELINDPNRPNYYRYQPKNYFIGGPLVDATMAHYYSGETEENQQMQRGHAIYLNYPNAEGALTGAARIGGIDIGAAIGKATGIKGLPFGHAGVILVDENGNSDYYDYGRYKAGTDKYGVSTFGTIKKGKGNWRIKKLPAQKQGENDSVYVARIQGGLPDTEFGAYQAMSFPNINIEEARAYVTKQANDPNRRTYGAGNTCVDAAYRSIVPFIQDTKAVQKMLEPSVEEYNTEGYSPFAQFWSLFPWSVGNTSAKMRKVADKTYIMNKKK